jgi:hypothetical protein
MLETLNTPAYYKLFYPPFFYCGGGFKPLISGSVIDCITTGTAASNPILNLKTRQLTMDLGYYRHFFIELANDIQHPIHSKHLYILFEWPLENNLIHKTRDIEAYT